MERKKKHIDLISVVRTFVRCIQMLKDVPLLIGALLRVLIILLATLIQCVSSCVTIVGVFFYILLKAEIKYLKRTIYITFDKKKKDFLARMKKK